MNILLNSNINDIKDVFEEENENEINKTYSIININKRRKTACEREAIFNRLILNNPTILSIDTTLLPGTCVYCNICQVRIILNPAYYLNNWRTHMNGKLHKALSKAVGSPPFLDEIDFCIDKEEDSYFDLINNFTYNNNHNNIIKIGNENINNTNVDITNQLIFNNNNDLNQIIDNNENISINNTNSYKPLSIIRNLANRKNIKKFSNNHHIYDYFCENQDNQNKIIEIIDENNFNNTEDIIMEQKNENQEQNYELIREQNYELIREQNYEPIQEEIIGKNQEKQIDINTKNINESVIHPLIANITIEKDNLVQDYNFVVNNDTFNNLIYSEDIQIDLNNSNINNEFIINKNKMNNDNGEDNNHINKQITNNLNIPVVSPLLRIQFESIGTFHCPGINKVKYWAMCFIGSERSTEHSSTLNYNDTRRVFYKQSIITKITPNHEPEHQGVVHHPNCLEIVTKSNEPCERCSLYINNRQLARVISKRATRLQEMWDRVIAGESILNGGKIPQSIISAYNHRIDHWSRCNDPLEAITRALAGCRQRDYTNFFWKIRENLLQNSRLIKNQI